jgi:hypothetical protein
MRSMVSCESFYIFLQESENAAVENNCPQVSEPMPAGETEVGCLQIFTGLRSGYEQSFDLGNGHTDDVGKMEKAP